MTKTKGKSKRQPILIKDSDRLLNIIESITPELNLKVTFKINVNNFKPENSQFLDTETTIFETPFKFMFQENVVN